VVVAVAVVGLFFLFGGKDNPIAAIIDPPPEVAEFSFAKVQAAYEATSAESSRDQLQKTADQTAPDVAAVVAELFQSGYVDPSGWGDAGAIEGLFTDDAAAQVEPNIDTLTLGTDVASSALDPGKSTVTVTALVDKDGKAVRAMADVEFKGVTTNDDGTYTDVAVTGTLFLVPDGDGWKIEAFRLQRNEKPGTAPSSPTASPTESV
jgi:hypothetical protein